jgi:hypothetical protein
MARWTLRMALISLSAFALLGVGACAEPECPQGFEKIGKICKRLDAGASENEGGVADREADAGLDATASVHQDGMVEETAAPRVDATTNGPLDATASGPSGVGPDATVPGDASNPGGDATVVVDAGAADAGTDALVSCGAGYVVKNGACQDVDECSLSNAVCHPSATCENQPGAFTCKCRLGFSGNADRLGRLCLLIKTV